MGLGYSAFLFEFIKAEWLSFCKVYRHNRFKFDCDGAFSRCFVVVYGFGESVRILYRRADTREPYEDVGVGYEKDITGNYSFIAADGLVFGAIGCGIALL